MAPTVIKGSKELGQKIKTRRKELGLTIEEAAKRAGVGTKTWSRYEKGDSIRKDKSRRVLKTLNWQSFPGQEGMSDGTQRIEIDSSHDAWSKYLETTFGKQAAAAFAAGSDILLDEINQDLAELARQPNGTHLGELDSSLIVDYLPSQFLMKYNYSFLHAMRFYLIGLRRKAKYGDAIIAHTVIEELIIYAIEQVLEIMADLGLIPDTEYIFPEGLLGELCEDVDLVTYLYSDLFYLKANDTYHYDRWLTPQFFLDSE